MSPAEPTITPLLLTRQQAAQSLNVCVRTVDALIAAKEFPVIRLGGGTVKRKGQEAHERAGRVLVSVDDLRGWIARKTGVGVAE